jgi:hypothetical protein
MAGHAFNQSKVKVTRAQELQAYTDALGALVTVMAFQVDPVRLIADLRPWRISRRKPVVDRRLD